jgi:hypothetical protein
MFSTLNNLNDISSTLSAGTLVGYTESEIKEYFRDRIEALKAKLNMTEDGVMNHLREQYNGYRFGVDTWSGIVSESIYNPFAINYVFLNLACIDEWSLSGSASMLSERLCEDGYRYKELLTISVEKLKSSCKPSSMTTTSLMYYGGYATIDKVDTVENEIILKIPNKSINKYLADDYLKAKFSVEDTTNFKNTAKGIYSILTLTPLNQMRSKIEVMSGLFDTLLNDYSYDLMSNEGKFRNIIDSILKISFDDVAHEIPTKNGKIDTIITYKSRIFIIEYKHMKSSSVALKQINDREYYGGYLDKNVPVLLFGISLMKNEDSKKKYVEISYELVDSGN